MHSLLTNNLYENILKIIIESMFAMFILFNMTRATHLFVKWRTYIKSKCEIQKEFNIKLWLKSALLKGKLKIFSNTSCCNYPLKPKFVMINYKQDSIARSIRQIYNLWYILLLFVRIYSIRLHLIIISARNHGILSS